MSYTYLIIIEHFFIKLSYSFLPAVHRPYIPCANVGYSKTIFSTQIIYYIAAGTNPLIPIRIKEYLITVIIGFHKSHIRVYIIII